MEVFFLFRPGFYERYYNCSAYRVEDIPLEKRENKGLGILFMLLSTIYEFLYVPCLISIGRHMRNNHCYKIMFYIGIVDMLAVPMNGWLTGYFGYIGAVFCSYPGLIYVIGAYGGACWYAETTVQVVLALNRCCELCSSDFSQKLFSGKTIWIWLLIPTLYGIALGILTTPPIFSSLFMTWFLNPHIGYLDDIGGHYDNIMHTIHNHVILFALFTTYLGFCIILYIKSLKIHSVISEQGYSQKMIFFQVFLISIINAIGAAIPVYAQYFQINEVIIVIGQLAWMNAHGIPPVIYLTMNMSIREDCKQMLFGCHRNFVASVQPANKPESLFMRRDGNHHQMAPASTTRITGGGGAGGNSRQAHSTMQNFTVTE